MTKKLKKIVIASGGTGGHIFPAYSLASHFSDRQIKVELISDKRGFKFIKETKSIKINIIPSATIINKNIFRKIVSIIIIFYSFFRSFVFLILNRPDLVFGMGGYPSFAFCIASKILGVPFIIYENNFHIGKANKYLLPISKKIFVSNSSLEGVVKKYKDKVVEIGNIVRKEILDHKRKDNFKEGKINILILGGSQAAKIFGEILPDILKKCSMNKISLRVYQQCLPYQKDNLEAFYRKNNIDAEIFNFDQEILNYFSKTNLAITRAGSSVLAELTNLNIPFISIPLPTSADNHQFKNATYYKKKNYGFLIDEKDVNSKLYELLTKITKDKLILDKIINNQRQFSDKSVYENIDQQVKKIIHYEY